MKLKQRIRNILLFFGVAIAALILMPISAKAEGLTQIENQLNIVYGALDDEQVALVKNFYDNNYYKNNNEDVVAAVGDSERELFNHFIKYGIFEDRQCCDYFNASAYASAYPELRRIFGKNPVLYYKHYHENMINNNCIATIGACAENNIIVYSIFDDSIIIKPSIYKLSIILNINSYQKIQAVINACNRQYTDNVTSVGSTNIDTVSDTASEPVESYVTPELAAYVEVLNANDSLFYYIMQGDNKCSFGVYRGPNGNELELVYSYTDYSVTADNNPLLKAPERCSNLVGFVNVQVSTNTFNNTEVAYTTVATVNGATASITSNNTPSFIETTQSVPIPNANITMYNDVLTKEEGYAQLSHSIDFTNYVEELHVTSMIQILDSEGHGTGKTVEREMLFTPAD